MNVRSTIVFLVPLTLALALGGLASGCDDGADAAHPPAKAAQEHDHGEEKEHAGEVRLTPQAIERFGIRIDTAKTMIPKASFTAPARLGYNLEKMAHITPAVQGRVADIKARLGDRVQAGDVLLSIESPELGRLQSDYLAQRASAASAEPLVEIARAAYERGHDLHTQSGGLSLAEVQRRKGELAAARGQLLAAQAAVAAARNNLLLHGMSRRQIERLAATGHVNPRYDVTAPIAGEVIDREVTLGELVEPAGRKLMVLADLGALWALVDVPEARLADVGLGTPVILEVGAFAQRTFTGKVAYIAPLVNEATRSSRLRVVVSNEQGILRPGMFAHASISTPARQQVLAIPADAVMTVQGQPAVFVPVPDEPNTFARRTVVTGARIGGFIPILSGLSAGEAIVTSGAFILKAELGKAGVEHHH